MPMPHTVIDFWRMVYEHNVCSVVMLNPMDETDEVRKFCAFVVNYVVPISAVVRAKLVCNEK